MSKLKPMKEVEFIVLHCTSTRPSQRVTREDIDRWHRARGWQMIGYHWYIDRDGEIFPGRDERYAGAHVRHYNEHAIGVCYEGGLDEKGRPADTRTPAQKAKLYFLLKDLKESYPQAKILGHRDFPNVAKACPSLNVQEVYADLNNPKEY